MKKNIYFGKLAYVDTSLTIFLDEQWKGLKKSWTSVLYE